MNYITKKYPIKRLFRKVIFLIGRRAPFVPGKMRAYLFYLGGVNFVNYKTNFIGYDVNFDDMNPELITVGEGTYITEGCKLLTHFVDVSYNDYNHHFIGKIEVGRDVFIGLNVIINKPIKIGDGAVIGSGSVVTKNVLPNTVVAGNPIRMIKDREITKFS